MKQKGGDGRGWSLTSDTRLNKVARSSGLAISYFRYGPVDQENVQSAYSCMRAGIIEP